MESVFHKMLARLAIGFFALGSPLVLAGPREFGLSEFQAALAARNLRPEQFRLRYEVDTQAPQTWRISGLRISGGDMRGLMYGLLEAADQIAATGRLRPANGAPTFAIRGVRLRLTDPPQVAGQESWQPFFAMLARARFNQLRLILDEPEKQVGMVKALSELAAEFGIEVLPRLWRPAIPEQEHGSVPVYEVSLGDAPKGLPWGDPIYARRIVADARQKGYDAIEIETSLPFPEQWLSLLIWGRAMFDVDAMPAPVSREFAKRFGKDAAPAMQEAYSLASRAVSLSDPDAPGPPLTALARAQAFHTAALKAQQTLDSLAKMFSPEHAEWKAAEPGLRKLVTLGRFHGRASSAEEMLALFRSSGNDTALRSARQNYRAATRLAGELEIPFTPPDLENEVATEFGPLSYPEPVDRPAFQHVVPKAAVTSPTLALRLRVTPTRSARTVRLHYRQLPDQAEFTTIELPAGQTGFQIKPTGDLQYYFEVVNREGTSWFDPDPLGAIPYYFVPAPDQP